MAEKITLASFDIDIEALTKATAETFQAIESIKKEQKEMINSGKTTDVAFGRNAVNLKLLQKEYTAQINLLEKTINQSEKQANAQGKINDQTNKEVVNIKNLKAENKELIAQRNLLNIETEEGAQAIALLNAQIDKNDELIKENSSSLEKQKIGIGAYADGIKDAFGDLGLFNGELDKMKGVFTAVSPLFDKFKDQLKDATKGFKEAKAGTEGMTGAQKAQTIMTNLSVASLKLLKLALIGTGIGAIVVLLGSFVAYLQGSEEASNRLGKILGVLGGIVSRLMKYLEPLGELIMDGLVKGFEILGKTATGTINLIASGLEKLGFDKASQGLKNFNNEMKEASKNAEVLTGLEQKLTEAQRQQGLIQLQYQQRAEKARQVRDNEALSIGKRIKANEDLGAVLKEQLNTEMGIATQALQVANLRIAQDGRTAKNLDAQAEAMEKVFEINERITGQESEQLTNRNSLQKEAVSLAKEQQALAVEASKKRVDQMKAELDLYIEQQSKKAKTLEQELAMEQDFSSRRKKILDAELNSKLISQTQYNTEILKLETETNFLKADIAVRNAENELKAVEKNIEIQTALRKGLNKTFFDEEMKNEALLREERSRSAFIKYQEGVINETEYLDTIAELNHQFQLKQIETDQKIAEAEKERKIQQRELDYESAMITLESISKDEFKAKQLQIEQQREIQIENARIRYTDEVMLAQAILNINGQASLASTALEKEANKAKLESKIALLENVAGIIGEETAIGKSASVARTAMTTYEASMNAYSALAGIPVVGPALGAIAATAVGIAGAKNISKILSTDTSISASVPSVSESATPTQAVIALDAVPPFATGGKITDGVPIKRSNGDDVLITAKKDEVILNEVQQQLLGGDETFRALGIKGFATGGLVGSPRMSTMKNNIFNQSEIDIADIIAEAVEQGAKIGTETGTRKGIVDYSTESYIKSISSS